MDFLQYPPFPEDKYNEVVRLIKNRTGMDLKGYRKGVAQRRIARRARTRGFQSIDKYMEFLATDREEARALVRLVTIQVSQFFRNPEVFRALGLEILPGVFASKGEGEPVRIWSVGCAEGEEPYSVAMLLLEYHNRRLARNPAEVLGTDVNSESIDRASKGVYETKKMALVDDLLKRRYFRPKAGAWEIRPMVRKLVRFRVENTFRGKGLDGADVVLARNMLIYFDRERQEALLRKMVKSINEGGYLILGKSETMPLWSKDSFRPVFLRERIYRKV